MKTKDAMSGGTNLLDNLIFEDNDAMERIGSVLCEDSFTYFNLNVIRGWTSGIDADSGDVLLFLRTIDVNSLSCKEREELYSYLRKKLAKEHFDIIEEKDIDSQTYFHVAFTSHFYRLKDLKLSEGG